MEAIQVENKVDNVIKNKHGNPIRVPKETYDVLCDRLKKARQARTEKAGQRKQQTEAKKVEPLVPCSEDARQTRRTRRSRKQQDISIQTESVVPVMVEA